MIRRFLKWLLTKPVVWLANKFSSRPDEKRVLEALSKLYKDTQENPGKKGVVFDTTVADARFIIFSDQHRGAKDGSDDFMKAEPTYLAALDYYLKQHFHFISLSDEEELWENLLGPVKENNKASIDVQQQFLHEQRYTKVFGNHDIFWNNDPFAGVQLKSMYGEEVKIYEAVLLQIKTDDEQLPIFLTHGHQGDGQSDANPFSAWFVGRIWAPLQSYLGINLNIPSVNDHLKSAHNLFMYEWSKQQRNPVLITGHTHQPVFASLTELERLYKEYDAVSKTTDNDAIEKLKKEIHFKQDEYDFVVSNYTTMKPCYFNSGCCCFSDGDITGIEIADGVIRLVRWKTTNEIADRKVIQEMELKALF